MPSLRRTIIAYTLIALVWVTILSGIWFMWHWAGILQEFLTDWIVARL